MNNQSEDIIKLLLDIQSDIKSIKLAQEKSEKNNTELESKLLFISKKISIAEKTNRASNLILYGVADTSETNNNLFQNIINLIKKLQVDINELIVTDIYRIGKKMGNRPIVIKLLAPRWKQVFFQKIANFKKNKLNIDNDLTKEEREVKKQLLKTRYLLKQKKIFAKLKGNQLWLNNSPLSQEQIEFYLANKTSVSTLKKGAFEESECENYEQTDAVSKRDTFSEINSEQFPISKVNETSDVDASQQLQGDNSELDNVNIDSDTSESTSYNFIKNKTVNTVKKSVRGRPSKVSESVNKSTMESYFTPRSTRQNTTNNK